MGRAKLRGRLGWIAVLCAVVFAVLAPVRDSRFSSFCIRDSWRNTVAVTCWSSSWLVDGGCLGFLGKIT